MSQADTHKDELVWMEVQLVIVDYAKRSKRTKDAAKFQLKLQISLLYLQLKKEYVKFAYRSPSSQRLLLGVIFNHQKGKQREDSYRHGMGMDGTFANHRYGWWRPKADWNNFQWIFQHRPFIKAVASETLLKFIAEWAEKLDNY